MLDRLGRNIQYLRISIIESCNLKCIYCSPAENTAVHKSRAMLSPEEIERAVSHLAALGIQKVRITGGEPLLRSDCCEIVERISRIAGITDISMTTNGIHLVQMAEDLKKAGLKRLNISLDSLKPERFEYITGSNKLKETLEGIKKAMAIGLHPVKINTVLIKGVNDDEVGDFIQLAKDNPLDVRFIELMPIGKFGEDNADKVIRNSDILSRYPDLVFVHKEDKGQPAQYYKMGGYEGRIGFISPMSHKFCKSCNRIRLTSDGKIRPCLGNNGEVDITDVLRKQNGDLAAVLEEIIHQKPTGHHFEDMFSSSRNMNRIGG